MSEVSRILNAIADKIEVGWYHGQRMYDNETAIDAVAYHCPITALCSMGSYYGQRFSPQDLDKAKTVLAESLPLNKSRTQTGRIVEWNDSQLDAETVISHIREVAKNNE